MIRAVYRNGKIQPLDEVPANWRDGQELIVDALVGVELRETVQQWAAEIQAAEEDHDRFMKALEEVERQSKELGRREMEKAARLFADERDGD